jgi:hypothetical protein
MWWFTPVMLVTQEAEAAKLYVGGQPGQHSETLSQKQKQKSI